MPRPKNSAYISHFQIYLRLRQGPLWLGDWRSTGLKSRTTVNNRLKYLLKIGLLSKTREGHKMMYRRKSFSGNSSKGFITWIDVIRPKNYDKLWKKMCDKIPTTENFLSAKKFNLIFSNWISVKDNPEIIELATDLGEKIKESGYRLNPRLMHIVSQYFEGNLCSNCLKSKIASFYITDAFSSEHVCPKCGFVNTTGKLPQIAHIKKSRLGTVSSLEKQLKYIRK